MKAGSHFAGTGIRMSEFSSIYAVIGFMIIHLLSKYLSFHSFSLRKFLSFSGGIAVAYVFIHLLPSVAHAQHEVVEAFGWETGVRAQYFIYIVALAGLSVFYALDRMVYKAWARLDIKDPDDIESTVFWLHIGFFTLYNAMIGYIVASHGFHDLKAFFLYFVAYALHFITNDWGLRHHLKELYDKYARFALAAGVLLGWVLGAFTDFPPFTLGLMEAFITGAMAFLAIKEELPSGEDGSLAGFLMGAVSATFLFVLL